MLLLLLNACRTHAPEDTVVDEAEMMLHLADDLRPEVLLFPKYLLPEDFELEQHGRIPGTALIGAGLKANRSLSGVRKEIKSLLNQKDWIITKEEVTEQSFRIKARLQLREKVEIRGVQGSGPTQLFILLDPSALSASN